MNQETIFELKNRIKLNLLDIETPDSKRCVNNDAEVELREGLKDTPNRVAKMYSEIFSGYNEDPREHLKKTFSKELDNEHNSDDIVIVKDIEFFSHCEHHMVPFFGSIDVGYIPNDRIVGLSKIVRVVEGYAKRLQVQERLGIQIATAIYEELKCKGAIVRINAFHLCMKMRGVKNSSANTTTLSFNGYFNDYENRKEFLSML